MYFTIKLNQNEWESFVCCDILDVAGIFWPKYIKTFPIISLVALMIDHTKYVSRTIYSRTVTQSHTTSYYNDYHISHCSYLYGYLIRYAFAPCGECCLVPSPMCTKTAYQMEMRWYPHPISHIEIVSVNNMPQKPKLFAETVQFA